METAGLTKEAGEILFVNDGSVDGTRETLDWLARRSAHAAGDAAEVRVLHLASPLGRFLARRRGAEMAAMELVLFVDTRVTFPPNFGSNLRRLLEGGTDTLMGYPRIDVSRNIYCLYWERSHRFIFRRHFRDLEKGLTLTAENYERYAKGTGVFLCPREVFLSACAKFNGLLSDDTYLMKEIVKTHPIRVDPRLYFYWVPRERLGSFLGRLWERGPGFAEYHIFTRRGLFFVLVMAGIALLLLTVILLAWKFWIGVALIAGLITAAFFSAALFARGIGEFFCLAPLHMAVLCTFGAAALWGIVYHCGSRFRFRRRK
jgi:glycosyltransferase involved in cell wall biosynthesis